MAERILHKETYRDKKTDKKLQKTPVNTNVLAYTSYASTLKCIRYLSMSVCVSLSFSVYMSACHSPSFPISSCPSISLPLVNSSNCERVRPPSSALSIARKKSLSLSLQTRRRKTPAKTREPDRGQDDDRLTDGSAVSESVLEGVRS